MGGEAEEIVFRKHPFRMLLEFLYLLFWLGMALLFAAGLLAGDPQISERVSPWLVMVIIVGVLGGGLVSDPPPAYAGAAAPNYVQGIFLLALRSRRSALVRSRGHLRRELNEMVGAILHQARPQRRQDGGD